MAITALVIGWDTLSPAGQDDKKEVLALSQPAKGKEGKEDRTKERKKER